MDIIKRLIKQTDLSPTQKPPLPLNILVEDRFSLDFGRESRLIQQKQRVDAKSTLEQWRGERQMMESQLERQQTELDKITGSGKTEQNLRKAKSNKLQNLKIKLKQLNNRILSKEKQNEINSLDVQYYRIYTVRVALLTRLYARHAPVDQIADLAKRPGRPQRIVGVIAKKLSKQVSYLKKIEEPDFEDFEQRRQIHLFSKHDKVFIEDQSGRVELAPSKSSQTLATADDNWLTQLEHLHPLSLATGTVVCAHGSLSETGVFNVSRFEFLPLELVDVSTDAPQRLPIKPADQDEGFVEMPYTNGGAKVIDCEGSGPKLASQVDLSIDRSSGADCYMAIVSSLQLSEGLLETTRFANLREFLTASIAPRISAKVLLLMGSVFQVKPNLNICVVNKFQYKENFQDFVEKQTLLARFLDLLIEEFLAADPDRVCLLCPGFDDPTSIFYPQEPFKSFLFERSHATGRLHLLTNPARVRINGRSLLISDGRNLTDYEYQSDLSRDSLGRLEMLSRHIYHTCPSSLSMFPFNDSDPFVLVNGLPDVYLIGESAEFMEDSLRPPQASPNVILEEGCEGRANSRCPKLQDRPRALRQPQNRAHAHESRGFRLFPVVFAVIKLPSSQPAPQQSQESSSQGVCRHERYEVVFVIKYEPAFELLEPTRRIAGPQGTLFHIKLARLQMVQATGGRTHFGRALGGWLR